MGIVGSYITNKHHDDDQIGMIPNTNFMYCAYQHMWTRFFTNNFKFLGLRFISTYMRMRYFPQKFSICSASHVFDNVIDLSTIYPDIDINVSRYKLINICHPMYNGRRVILSDHIGFIIKLPALNSIKCHEMCDTTFHKYKLIHNILCLDVVNFIFQIIMHINIDMYYFTELDKANLSVIDDVFKHKFISAIHDNI